MPMMSPQEVNDDPKKWIRVPHELHTSLLGLMEKIFPGFTDKLKTAKVHCLKCDGKEPFHVYSKPEKKLQVITGYVGEPDSPDVLLWCKDIQ